MNPSDRSAIEQLIKIIEEGNGDELDKFLSTTKGFRSEQGDLSLTALHFVAGKEFETAKKAQKWLYYLVKKRKMNIEERSVVGQLRPLHCACKWGSIFGVNWLVRHGANVNVKDKIGRSTYFYACSSSLDRMKKMLCLEEHGYCLLPLDIVLAAENNFAYFEEARDVFHHLVSEKKMNVDTVDEYQASPLHHACVHGNIFGVKCLLEHNASINIVNERGQTPFMLACGSRIDRSLKVLHLGERGADFLAKDKEGRTALFDATVDSKCENDVKVVLQYLVNEKCIDVNSVDKNGRTPFLHACRYHPSFVVIKTLIELGTDFLLKDQGSQNALHYAAANPSTDKSIIDLLVEVGVDVACEDEDGLTPHQVARDGEIRAFLRQHYDAVRFSVLKREKVRPDSIKICVIGSEMAGKTTFVSSLLRLNLPPIEPDDRTAGVQIHKGPIPGVGKGTAWDFGAQSTFHRAHGLFFGRSNSMFSLVLPIREEKLLTPETGQRLLEKGRFWCAFAKASLRALPSHLNSLIPLIVIFNLIELKEEAGSSVNFQLKKIADILQIEFEGTFKVVHVIELDCSKSQSVRMADCREKLKNVRERMLKAADDVPKLCHAIEEYLSLSDEKRKKPLAYFLTVEEFEKWVSEEVGITLSDGEKKVAVEYLDSSGLIVNLGFRICVRPLWLCHNVIGPLLAPPYFMFSMPTAGKSGKTSKTDIELALRAFQHHLEQKGTAFPYVVKADTAIEVLLDLDLCIPVKDVPGEYEIPALLDDLIPHDTWEKVQTLDVYRGQRYECVHSIDIISPSSFAVFQCRCSRMISTSRVAWKDGVKLVKVVKDKEVECLVESGIKKERCCIDVILRWSNKTSHRVAEEFLVELKAMIVAACEERSPGVVLNWFYLDSTHLQQHDQDPATYSYREVHEKVNDQAFDDILFSTRPAKVNRSRVRNLLIRQENASEIVVASKNPVQSSCDSGRSFPADDEMAPQELIRACAFLKGEKWEDVGLLVGISLNDVNDIRASTNSNVARMVTVLEWWTTRAESPTVAKLLGLFAHIDVSRRAIKKKYEDLSKYH